MRRDLFNDRVWPDLPRLAPPGAPFLTLRALEEGRPVELEGLRLTPIAVNHPVPTVGLLIEEGCTTVVIATDTGPTAAIWELAKAQPGLRAVFLDIAFPDAMASLAELSGHLTPAGFAVEASKLPVATRLLAIHLKPRHYAEIAAEFAALALPNAEICRPGLEYQF